MRILGLDLGSRTLGVAISDPLGIIARALTTIRFDEDDYDRAVLELSEIIKKENITEIVLGLPKHMNGDEGIRANISYEFKDKILFQLPNVKIHLVDERRSTHIANEAMFNSKMDNRERKKRKDEMAAVVILQKFLDKRG